MHKLTYLVAALLMLLFNLPTNAQHHLGIIGGLSFAEVEAEVQREPAEVSNRTLFGIGGVVDLSLNRTLSLRLEPMYLQKGAGESELAIQPGVEWRMKSSCLELPLFLKAEFGNTVRPYVMAGPSIGILLSSDLEADLSGVTFKGEAKDATESIDFAAAFGAGVSYPLGRSSIFLEGRYSFGLTNTVKGGTVELAAGPLVDEILWNKETDKIKNRGLQIMAGVTYALGGR